MSFANEVAAVLPTGAVIFRQTLIAKTTGNTGEDAVFMPEAMVAATQGEGATRTGKEVPGDRSKAAAVLRAELVVARAYLTKGEEAEPDLWLSAMGTVLKGEVPLLITVERANDIMTALRIAKEFALRVVLDGAAEITGVLDEVRAAGVPVILHATMKRATGETVNLSMETAAQVRAAGIPFALQSGFESYVPKTRVVLFEASIACANGQSFDEALGAITIDAARILGVDQRVGVVIECGFVSELSR